MATKKNIKDVPQAGSAAVLLGADSENRWVKISGVAGGDLSGTLPSPTIRQNVELSGAPTAPTPAKSTDSTRIATTAYVKSNLVDYATKADMIAVQNTANEAKELAELTRQTIDRMPYMESFSVLSAIYTRDLQTVMVAPQSNPAPKSIFVKFTAEEPESSMDRLYVCYLLILNVWGGTYTIYYNGSITDTYTIKVPAAAAGIANTYIPVTLTFWVRKGETDAYGYRAESMTNATVTVDTALSTTSVNPVQNKVVTNRINSLASELVGQQAITSALTGVSSTPITRTNPLDISVFIANNEDRALVLNDTRVDLLCSQTLGNCCTTFIVFTEGRTSPLLLFLNGQNIGGFMLSNASVNFGMIRFTVGFVNNKVIVFPEGGYNYTYNGTGGLFDISAAASMAADMSLDGSGIGILSEDDARTYRFPVNPITLSIETQEGTQDEETAMDKSESKENTEE